MAVNVTPEVAAAHKKLEKLCEKFETSVDELCASSPQLIRPHQFYECEFVPIAAECVDVLSELQSASSYEVTAYQNAIAAADSALCQQKRELEENAAQRGKIYEDEIVVANKVLGEQKHELEENAAQRGKIYEDEIVVANKVLGEQKRELGENAVQRAEECEKAVTAANIVLGEQERKLGENAVQRAEECEKAVTAANIVLGEQERELEENAAQSVITIQSEVEEFSDVAEAVGVNFSDLTGIDAKELLEKTTVKSSSKNYYRKALAEAKHHDVFNPVLYFLSFVAITTVWILALTFLFSGPVPESFFFIGGILSAMLAIICYKNKKNKITKALGTFRSAAIEECGVIREEMQNAVTNALAARDKEVEVIRARKEKEDKQAAETAANALAAYNKKVEDIRVRKEKEDKQAAEIAANALAAHDKEVENVCARKEREDKQAAETAANALAAHDKEVENVCARKKREDKQAAETAADALAAYDKKIDETRSKRDRAIAYIQQEYQVFDKRLCQCLDKFQSLVDTWTAENAYVTAILNENWGQNLSENSERIESRLTRVGTVGVWGPFEVAQYGAEAVRSVPTIQPVRLATADQNDMETVKYYLQAIANGDEAFQPIRLATADQNDMETVKYYLQVIANADKQENNEALTNLNRMAEPGDAKVQFILGGMYEKGIGVRQDKGKAVEWYRQAAAQGHIDALNSLNGMAEQGDAKVQFILGSMYEKGTGVRQDKGKAVEWYRQAAAQGHIDALNSLNSMAEQGDAEVQFILGSMYEKGTGVRQDKGKAVEWYQKAAAQGHADALNSLNRMAEQGDAKVQFILGGMYEKGIGARQDKGKAVEWYQKAAAQGHADALNSLNRMAEQGDAKVQFILGGMYERINTGVQQDTGEAANWYRKAAEQGHVDAQYELGEMYEKGWGVQKNYTEAVYWYRKAAGRGNAQAKESLPALERLEAASQGNADAQYELGKMHQNSPDNYEDDLTARVNHKEAAEWYFKAAHQGHVGALENLAEMFDSVFLYHDEEAEKSYIIGRIYYSQNDYEEAAEWYERAAVIGHADAQCQLGRMYDMGEGVVENEKKAVEWYREAAEQGHADGQYWLGLRYSLELDYFEAAEWYQKAAAQGHKDAKKALRSIERGG